MTSIEFRIPISPTQAFFDQIDFFSFTLRRLGGIYEHAKIMVFVGDANDLPDLEKRNPWSRDRGIEWVPVPREIYDEFSFLGTADWRLAGPGSSADLIILCDADTFLAQPIDALITMANDPAPRITGHIAHFPPEESGDTLPSSQTEAYWPALFKLTGTPWAKHLYHYTLDTDEKLPLTPAYFNYGFVALNCRAFEIIRPHTLNGHRELLKLTTSFMKCQINLAILGAKFRIKMDAIDATYNAANDDRHTSLHNLDETNIKVVHYLRNEEFDRSKIGSYEYFCEKMDKMQNPANRLLIQHLAEWHDKKRAACNDIDTQCRLSDE